MAPRGSGFKPAAASQTAYIEGIRTARASDFRLRVEGRPERPPQAESLPYLVSQRGYTLIELIIVMAIVSVLVSIAVPLYTKAIARTKETVLKQNLFNLRTVIDEYTFDKKAAPQNLEDLVTEGYLRAVPVDPITGRNDTWRVIMEDSLTMVDQTQPGIFDVRSGSSLISLEGTPYSEW
jgi:general secretion pathway protein G